MGNKAKVITWYVIAVSVVASLLAMLLPLPRGSNPVDFYFDLIVSLMTMIFYIGGSIVIVGGFKVFTSKLRRAYTIVFAGLILWALGYLQLPLIVFFDLLHNDLVISITVIPYVVSAALVFTGTRMLAKLFDVKTITTKWWFAAAAVAVASTIAIVMPHGALAPGSTEEGGDAVNGLIMAVAALFTLSAYHLLLVKRKASVAYMNALAWLCLSMVTVAWVAAGGSTVAALIAPADTQLTIVVAIIPSCVAGALFLRSAYSFATISESTDVEGVTIARNFFGQPLKPPVQDATTSLDIVLYAAGLASNRNAIDPQLEAVRGLTSRMQADQQLAASDEAVLMDTYSQIEDYLLHKESLRMFTKESLRQDIAQKLRLGNTGGTFWAKLT